MNRLKPLMLLLSLSVIVMLGLTGCGGSRVVFVHPSDGLLRLGPDVRGHVYYWNGSSWELSGNSVDLPEGWFAGDVQIPTEDNAENAAH